MDEIVNFGVRQFSLLTMVRYSITPNPLAFWMENPISARGDFSLNFSGMDRLTFVGNPNQFPPFSQPITFPQASVSHENDTLNASDDEFSPLIITFRAYITGVVAGKIAMVLGVCK